MKVLHLPFTWHPDPIGGTEVYVQLLAEELLHLDVESVIACPGGTDGDYSFGKFRVIRFSASPRDLTEQYCGIREFVSRAESMLTEIDPDVVHLHSFVPAHSVPMVEALRRLKIPYVFTYHTPTATCARGTMLLYGLRPCDGRVESLRCCQCSLESLGVPRPISAGISRVSRSLDWLAPVLPRQLGTAVRLRRLLDLRAEKLGSMLSGAAAIVSLTRWTTDVMTANDVDKSRLIEIEHGIDPIHRSAADDPNRIGALRLAFVGRLSKEKGLGLLREVLQKTEGEDFTLDVFGVDQGGGIEKLPDGRVRAWAGLPRLELLDRLQTFDALVVPSQWMETGPLVVLEARSLGVPILGSALGGISDKVEHGVDGFLVAFDDAEAWAELIRSLARDPARVRCLQPRPVLRTAASVAREMLGVYRAVAASRASCTVSLTPGSLTP